MWQKTNIRLARIIDGMRMKPLLYWLFHKETCIYLYPSGAIISKSLMIHSLIGYDVCQTMTSPSRRDKRRAAGPGLKEHHFQKPNPGTLIESLGTTRVSEHIISVSAVLPPRSRNHSWVDNPLYKCLITVWRERGLLQQTTISLRQSPGIPIKIFC